MPLLDLFSRRAQPRRAWQLPPAPSHWRRMREGLGPVRRWGVPLMGLGALAAAAAAGMWWLPKAADPLRVARQAPDALLKLQPLLGGQTLQVPSGSGIWAWQQAGVHLVALRARADGPARVINLCERRTGAKHAPDSIYPLTVVGDLRAMAGDRRIARTALVVPAAVAGGMPLLSVVGTAPDRLDDMDLRLQLSPAAGAAAGSWQLAMASSVAEGRPAVFRLQQEAWLLWGAPGGATGGKEAARPGPQRHSHAIRVRWQPQSGCAAGGLQWQLFDAQGLAPVAERGPAVLWAVRAGEPLGGAAPLRLALAAGPHAVPQAPPLPLEDKDLFDAALRAGMITPTPDQRLAVAPADLFRAKGAAAEVVDAAASGAQAAAAGNADRAALLKALYAGANGSFVRQQIELANQARHWLALSLHEDDAQRLAPAAQWRASALGELLTLDTKGLPDVQARLFTAWPRGWGPWVRLQAPLAWSQPGNADGAAGGETAGTLTTTLRLPLRAAAGATDRQPVRLLMLGQLAGLEGGTLVRAQAACQGPGCPMPELLQELAIQPAPGAEALVLHLQPQNRFLALRPERAEQLRVQWEPDGRGGWVPAWKSPGGSGWQAQPPAEVSVVAKGGVALFESGAMTPDALQLGLLPVLGVGVDQAHGLVGMLQRLGTQHGQPKAEAKLTFVPRYQRLLNDILQCMGGSGGDWLVAESRCSERETGTEWLDHRRQAHAVVMGADTGEILAAASSARLDGVTPERLQPGHPFAAQLLGFERFNPASSPLKPGAWVHYGGSVQGPGSTFKLPQALALENKGKSDPAVRAALGGLGLEALDAQARGSGLSFAAAAACYPAPCPPKGQPARQPYVENFGNPAASAARAAEDGRLGLVQALRSSVNTWFAYMGERVDGTAALGYAGAQGLGDGALSNERPMQAVLAALGWEQRWMLDGGLLPEDFDWQGQDVLRTSASVADPFVDRHSIRQQAIGVRLQTTPLAMASVAAAVATGRVVKPRLLAELNGQRAVDEPGAALDMPLQRVRAGLAAVVMNGTAARAFAAPALQAVKPLVSGKTGSAPMGNRPDQLKCPEFPLQNAAPLVCQNAAWFVGYLQPGAIPGETRPLAFAVQITHTRLLGGGLAAPVIARWLEAVRAEQARQAAPMSATAGGPVRPSS